MIMDHAPCRGERVPAGDRDRAQRGGAACSDRDGSGYGSYREADAARVGQIRGLLEAGLTTEIIRRILPFLDCGIHLPAQCLTADTARLLEREAERLGQRIDCLSRHRDALLRYLAATRGPLADGVGEQGDLVR